MLDKKKGISNLVATVLLIGFVVALVLVAFLWGKNFILERAQKEGKLSEKQLECEDISISIVNTFQQGNQLFITLKNEKDLSVEKFVFRIQGAQTEAQESFVILDSLTIKQYELSFTEDIVQGVNKVDIIPWIKVAKGFYVPCSSKLITAIIN